jgi:hypothetical protein
MCDCEVAGRGVHELNPCIAVAFGINEENVYIPVDRCFRGNCIGVHGGIGLLLIAEFVQVVIDTNARIFKVCPFYGLNVIELA